MTLEDLQNKLFETRRNRLQRLVDDECDGNAAELARVTSTKPTAVYRWLGARQNISEESAITLEACFGKPLGWLSGFIPDQQSPLIVAEPQATYRKPHFDHATQEIANLVQRLPAAEKRSVKRFVLMTLDDLAAASEIKKSG